MLSTALLLLAIAGPSDASRPYRLGFTPWPSDLTLEAVQSCREFAEKHGDIVSVMLIGGIPWPEALAGKPYSRDVENALSYRPPKGTPIFLSISPLDKERKGLAPYWGEKDNLPLPADWSDKALDSPEVKRAYAAFVLHAVEKMQPDYLAIVVEANVLLSNDKVKWQQLKGLYRHAYAEVKAAHPKLPVFFTTEVLHYKKLSSAAQGSDQEGEVAELMNSSDLFAMSLYPHMTYSLPRPFPADYLEFATRFHKPIAVSESGMTSRDVELKSYGLTLKGSEDEQKLFVQHVLDAAAKHRYRFVINFASTDFDRLCDKLQPPLSDLARIWAYTGLRTGDGQAKPALAVWDEALHKPLRP